MSGLGNAVKKSMSRSDIERVSREMLELLEASGLSPLEGLTAVEALYSLLLLRGMDAAAGNLKVSDAAREVALRSVNRMASRIIAWPARTADKQ